MAIIDWSSLYMSSILKDARLKAGLEIRDVARELRVKHQYLVAIEEEDFSLLPGQAYVNGYRRMYAKYLKVDLAELSSTQNEPEKIWVRPDRLEQYKGYKIVSLLSLFGFIILLLWYILADRGDDDNKRNLSDILLNKAINFNAEPVVPFVKEYELNNIE
jgi:transcriptional regulator with XRE-family HTH domain